VTILAPLLLILAASLERGKRGGWTLYGVILSAGFALPWLAFHFDKHVPLASFLQYVGILAVLNIVCIKEAWSLQRHSRKPVTMGENVGGGRAAGLEHG
jgi:peptidoglycan/LPS O-acetylase OafA/YrhL